MAFLPGTDASMPCAVEVAASASAGAPGELWEGRSQLQEVAPRVFLTNFFGARRKDLLAAAGITHVRTSVRECSVDCCPLIMSCAHPVRKELFSVRWTNWFCGETGKLWALLSPACTANARHVQSVDGAH